MSVRRAYIMLAGLSLAVVKEPTVTSSTFSKLLISLSRSASLAALHIPSLNCTPARLQHRLERIWFPLTSSGNGATSLGVLPMSTVTRAHADKQCCDDSTRERLEDWEMLSDEEITSVASSDESSERAAELVYEITELIDGSQEITGDEWDELIAMLGKYSPV
jgi:hypothetical protein